MSVRKRSWVTKRGVQKEAWIVDYADQSGVRRLKTFDRKKDADAFRLTAGVQVREGTHVADSASITVLEAGELWHAHCKSEGLEAGTLRQYRPHLRYHIDPFLGPTKLSRLTTPMVEKFRDDLLQSRSRALSRAILTSLKALLKEAKRVG